MIYIIKKKDCKNIQRSFFDEGKTEMGHLPRKITISKNFNFQKFILITSFQELYFNINDNDGKSKVNTIQKTVCG